VTDAAGTSVVPMPRRNLVPLVLLAVLAVLVLVFALVGASSAPGSATIAVQNATGETFGAPPGSTSFSMSLVNSLASVAGSSSISQTRLISYAPPGRTAVYQVGTSARLIAVLGEQGSRCALSAYTSIVGGPVAWNARGAGSYARTESLADYSGRVPDATGTTCSPRPSPVRGTVAEVADVKSGYLVSVRLTVVVPPQRLANGSAATHGVEGEALTLLKIDGRPTSALGS
jgi:hypothetical protein